MDVWTTIYTSPVEWRAALIGASETTFFDHTRAYDRVVREPNFITFLKDKGQTELARAIAVSPDFLIHDQNFITAYECYIVNLCVSYLNYFSGIKIGAISDYILYRRPLSSLDQDLKTLNDLMEALARLGSIIDWSAKQIFDQCFRVYARVKTDPESVDWDQVGKDTHLFKCAAMATGASRNLDTDLAPQFNWRNKIVTFTLIVANLLDRARGSRQLAHTIDINAGSDAHIFRNVMNALYRSGVGGTEMRGAEFLGALQQFFDLMRITFQKFRCGQAESDFGDLLQALPYNIPSLTARSPTLSLDLVRASSRQTYVSTEIEAEAPYTPEPPGTPGIPLQFRFFLSPQEWSQALDHENNTMTFNYLRAYNADLMRTPTFIDYINDVAEIDRARPSIIRGGYYASNAAFIKVLKNYYTALIQKALDDIISEKPRLNQALTVLARRESENSLRWIKDHLDPLYQALQHLTLVRDWEQKLIRDECMRRYGMVRMVGRIPASGDPVYGQCDTRSQHDRNDELGPTWKPGTHHERIELGDIKHLAFRNKLASLCQSFRLVWTFLQSGISSQGPKYGWPHPPGVIRPLTLNWGTISQTLAYMIKVLKGIFIGPPMGGTHRNEHPNHVSQVMIDEMAARVPNWSFPLESTPRIKMHPRESSPLAPPAKIQRPTWREPAIRSSQAPSSSSSVQWPPSSSSSDQWPPSSSSDQWPPSSSSDQWPPSSSSDRGLTDDYQFQLWNTPSGVRVGQTPARASPIVGRYYLNTRRND